MVMERLSQLEENITSWMENKNIPKKKVETYKFNPFKENHGVRTTAHNQSKTEHLKTYLVDGSKDKIISNLFKDPHFA